MCELSSTVDCPVAAPQDAHDIAVFVAHHLVVAECLHAGPPPDAPRRVSCSEGLGVRISSRAKDSASSRSPRFLAASSEYMAESPRMVSTGTRVRHRPGRLRPCTRRASATRRAEVARIAYRDLRVRGVRAVRPAVRADEAACRHGSPDTAVQASDPDSRHRCPVDGPAMHCNMKR